MVMAFIPVRPLFACRGVCFDFGPVVGVVCAVKWRAIRNRRVRNFFRFLPVFRVRFLLPCHLTRPVGPIPAWVAIDTFVITVRSSTLFTQLACFRFSLRAPPRGARPRKRTRSW